MTLHDRILPIAIILTVGLTVGSVPAAAQTSPQSAEQSVRGSDNAFWRAFNACDAKSMADFFADDVEFYHDITGLTRSRNAVTASLMKGPCGTQGLQIRRELVPNGVFYQAIPGYGAILTGEHLFYARRGSGAEEPATHARFLTIWKNQSGRWLITRVVSYGHGPVPYRLPATSFVAPPDALHRYVGTYRTKAFGDIEVTLERGTLHLQSGGLLVTLAASAPDRFFALERDLRFVFSGGSFPKMIEVEENGAIVASGTRAKTR
jgi:ketosteroid isomerase-like protein